MAPNVRLLTRTTTGSFWQSPQERRRDIAPNDATERRHTRTPRLRPIGISAAVMNAVEPAIESGPCSWFRWQVPTVACPAYESDMTVAGRSQTPRNAIMR